MREGDEFLAEPDGLAVVNGERVHQ
ncbi:MAG: hypothetical protein QOJ80_4491, partial [Mycobacterium sp.]|nr:hypothetical protein [Mycobacterium sp.]